MEKNTLNTKRLYQIAKVLRHARGSGIQPEVIVSAAITDIFGYQVMSCNGKGHNEIMSALCGLFTTGLDYCRKQIVEWWPRHAALMIGGAEPFGDLPSDRSTRKVLTAVKDLAAEYWDLKKVSAKEKWKVFHRLCRIPEARGTYVCAAAGQALIGDNWLDVWKQTFGDESFAKNRIVVHHLTKAFKIVDEDGYDLENAIMCSFEYFGVPKGKLPK